MTFTQWLIENDFIASAEEESQISAKSLAKLKTQYEADTKKPAPESVDEVLAKAKRETERRQTISDLTASFLIENPQRDADFIAKIEALATCALEGGWTAEKYDTELLRASRPVAPANFRSRQNGVRTNNAVIEAAICMAGRLDGHEDLFDDQTLQAAHDQFRNGIGLKQVYLMCAEANGYRSNFASDITIDVQRYAFGMVAPNRIQAQGWSALDIATILSNSANKFLRDGWNSVDMTPLRVAAIRNVRDFKQITTVSLTGALQFEKLGPGGEIKHGTLSQLSYTNQADTYAAMLAITRTDYINDDLGALTSAPRRLGRGAGLKLNDIFWTEFLGLEAAGFFAAGNANINTGVANMTLGGLAATEVIFMNQTDPDGKPLGVMPAILLVPTALKTDSLNLMTSGQLITGASSTLGDNNVFRGRFRVESSPYMSNSSYTGFSASEWYMLADPNEMPVIEIAALNGRVEPTVETADADFNVLGTQMRGYSDIGVNEQEYRGGVLADGGSS